jgi:hypothetical protein
MTGHARDDERPFSFLDIMANGSRRKAAEMWENLFKDTGPQQEELQLKYPHVVPVDLEGQPIECWVLASSQPEIGMDGTIRSIMGSIADISQIKWVQGLQDRRLRDAEETKRQQNEFIDITSHEMRGECSPSNQQHIYTDSCVVSCLSYSAPIYVPGRRSSSTYLEFARSL